MRTLAGAGIGMLGGAVGGGVIGLAADDPRSEYYGLGAFVGAILGGGIGLMMGTIFGALPHEQWRPVELVQDRSGVRIATLHRAQGDWTSDLSLGYAQGLSDHYAARGSISAVLDAFYSRGSMALGVEGGYHGLGTQTWTYHAMNGAVVREESSWNLWQATVAFKVRRPNGRFRPYGVIGAGVYFLHTQNAYEDRDTNGATSRYEFGNTNASPAFNVGVGALHEHTIGLVSLGFNTRWHWLLFDPAEGSFLTFSALMRIDL